METRPRLPCRKFLIRAATEREKTLFDFSVCVCRGKGQLVAQAVS